MERFGERLDAHTYDLWQVFDMAMQELPQGFPFLQTGLAPVDVVGVDIAVVVPTIAAGVAGAVVAAGCASLLKKPGFLAGATGAVVDVAAAGVVEGAVAAILQAALLALPFLVQS